MHANVQGVREALPSGRAADACSRHVVAFLSKERMNERINARAQDGKVDDQMRREISRIAERFDENAIGCKVMHGALIRCQEGNGVYTVSFRCAIRLRG